MLRLRSGAVGAVLLTSLVVAACGGSAPPPTAPADGLPSGFELPGVTTTYDDVVLAPEAVVVERAAVLDGLRAITPTDTGAALAFEAGTPGVGDLEVGQVVAFEALGLARVSGVHEADGRVIVEAVGATLDEFIQDGTLGFDAPISFDALPPEAYASAAIASGYQHVASAELTPGVRAQLAEATTELVFKSKIRDFDVEWKLQPKHDQIDYELEISRSNVKVTAKGFVTSFHQGARFEYDAGEATLVESEVTGMRGEAEITWAATQVKDPRDTLVEKLQLPLAIPFPIQIGPVPMTLTFKAAVRLVPAFETDQGSSGGSFKLSYDSDHGFSAETVGTVNPISRVKAFAADLGSKDTVTAGLGPTGFAIGLEFPRLELALGHPATGGLFQTYAFLTLDQYANGQFTPGTTLSADIPPCQRADIKVSAVAGYRFDVLGMVQVEDKTDLWTRTTEKFLDGKPCTLIGS
jgi:hypothetical protein